MTSLGAATPAERVAGEALPATPLSSSVVTLTSEERRVFELIPHGRANAIKQRYLARQCGCSTRTLQQVLKDLTELRGLPVASACSVPMGVFVPETQAEVDDYIAQLRSRAVSCFKRIRGLSRASACSLVSELRQEVLAFPDPANTRVRVVCACGCGEGFKPERSDQIYKNPLHRYRAANERKAAS